MLLVEFSPEYPLRAGSQREGSSVRRRMTHHLWLVYWIILDLFVFRQDIDETFQ